MSVRGSVIVRRIGVSPMVVIQAGTRTFRKKGTSYTPSSIAVRAEARNVKDAVYEWGNLVDGVFVLRTDWTGASITVTPARAGVVMVKVRGSNFEGEVTDYVDISVVEDGPPARTGAAWRACGRSITYRIRARRFRAANGWRRCPRWSGGNTCGLGW